MSQWAVLNQRMAGKWQIPLFAVSLLLLAGAYLRVRPDPAKLPVEEALAHIDTVAAAGLFERAIALGGVLLERDERSEVELAAVHLRLARAKYGRAREMRSHSAVIGRQIIDHYDHALANAESITVEDFARMGHA